MLFIVLIGFTIVKRKLSVYFGNGCRVLLGWVTQIFLRENAPCLHPADSGLGLVPLGCSQTCESWKRPPCWEAVSWLMDPGHKLPTVHSGKINRAFVAYYAGWLHIDTWKHDTEENERPSKLPLPLKIACQSYSVAGRQFTILLIRYIWGWVHWHGLWDWAPCEPAVL